jgi:hypothetical protein
MKELGLTTLHIKLNKIKYNATTQILPETILQRISSTARHRSGEDSAHLSQTIETPLIAPLTTKFGVLVPSRDI